MTYMPGFNRRSFMVGATAAGAGFALGLSLPSESDVVYAADGLPEVNAWVVIRPDETVVIRIMRSEMGQGSLTGLAHGNEEGLLGITFSADGTKLYTDSSTSDNAIHVDEYTYPRTLIEPPRHLRDIRRGVAVSQIRFELRLAAFRKDFAAAERRERSLNRVVGA